MLWKNSLSPLQFKKSAKATDAQYVFVGWRMCRRGFFLTWISLLTVLDSMASELCWHNKGTVHRGCSDQGEGQKEEKREQELLSLTVLSKPVCCGIVVWVWVSGWTGLNPSDLTLIKFKTYNQQSGDYSSFSLWGILGQSLKQLNLHLHAVFALNLELCLAFLQNTVRLVLIYVYIYIFLNVRKIVY